MRTDSINGQRDPLAAVTSLVHILQNLAVIFILLSPGALLREWTTAAGVKDSKATARALMVLFDGAVAGSEVDGPQRASDARWMARKLLAG